MVAGPAEAVKAIHTVLAVDNDPRPTRAVLLDIIIGQGWFPPPEAEDKADDWLGRFKLKLAHEIESARRTGSFISFAFNSSGNDYLQGYCFEEPTDDLDVRAAKRRRGNTLETYFYCRSITDRQLETLSGKILELLNVEQAHVSSKTADLGVDFYGRVPMGSMFKSTLLDQGAEKNLYVWLIGQAKHYPDTRVSTQEIRELVGSVDLARAGIRPTKKNPLAKFEAKLCDPVVFMFFTTGRFTRDSKAVLAQAGIIPFNGFQIAQFLADRGIGEIGGRFDAGAFSAWLAAPLKVA